MKRTQLIIFITFFGLLFGQKSHSVSSILKCLGKEEGQYHKIKSRSPLYFLNQEVISYFVELTESKFHDPLLEKRCPSPTSYYLIKRIILHPSDHLKEIQEKKLVSLPKTDQEIFQKKAIRILLNFLNETQKKESKVDCLKNNSESYKKLFQNMFYFEENISDLNVLLPKKELNNLFEDISALSLSNECSIPKGL